MLSPWRRRGQNKTSKQLQNTPDTNSFPHVTWRGLAGLLDYSDSGMPQPPTLRYLITSGGDGMPFWQSDYGQSDIDLKGARWGENLQGPICGSCWAQMKWGNGSSFKGMLLAVKDHKWLQLGTILRWSSEEWDSLHIQLLKLTPDVLTSKRGWFSSRLCTWVKGSVHKKTYFSTYLQRYPAVQIVLFFVKFCFYTNIMEVNAISSFVLLKGIISVKSVDS